MSFYFSNFNSSNITDVYSGNPTDPNYFQTQLFLAGYTPSGNIGTENLKSFQTLGNYISNYSTVTNALTGYTLVTSAAAPQAAFSFFGSLDNSLIVNCPSTVKAFVNFDGYIGTQVNTITVQWSYSQSTGYITFTYASHGFVQSQQVYLSSFIDSNGAFVSLNDGFAIIGSVTTNTFTVFIGTGFILNSQGSTTGSCLAQQSPIFSSYNISSVTRSAAGTYNLNFYKPFNDINYGIFGNGMNTNGLVVTVNSSTANYIADGGYKISSGVQIQSVALDGSTAYDYVELSVIITGNS